MSDLIPEAREAAPTPMKYGDYFESTKRADLERENADLREKLASVEKERDEWQSKTIKTALQGETYCEKLRTERDAAIARAEALQADLSRLGKCAGMRSGELPEELERRIARAEAAEHRNAEFAKAQLDWLNSVAGMDWFTCCDYGEATREAIDSARQTP